VPWVKFRGREGVLKNFQLPNKNKYRINHDISDRCRALQCAAVCCSVLQSVCCFVLQRGRRRQCKNKYNIYNDKYDHDDGKTFQVAMKKNSPSFSH